MPVPESYTVPAPVVIRAVAAILERGVAKLIERSSEHRRVSSKPRKIELQTDLAARLRSQIGALFAAAGTVKGDLDAAAFGLLIAVAQGHSEALADLERRTEEIKHPRLEEILSCRGTETDRLTFLLLDVRQSGR